MTDTTVSGPRPTRSVKAELRRMRTTTKHLWWCIVGLLYATWQLVRAWWRLELPTQTDKRPWRARATGTSKAAALACGRGLLECLRHICRLVEAAFVPVGAGLAALSAVRWYEVYFRARGSGAEVVICSLAAALALCVGVMAVGYKPNWTIRAVAWCIFATAIGYGVLSLPWAATQAHNLNLTSGRIELFDKLVSSR